MEVSVDQKINVVMSTDQVFVHFSLPLHMLPHHKNNTRKTKGGGIEWIELCSYCDVWCVQVFD